MQRRTSEQNALAALAEQVYRRTGITLDEGKQNLLSGRIRRRCLALGLGNLREYVELLETLEASSEEWIEFVEAVTTHKTLFFRTAGIWPALRKELVARAERQGSADVWSAACSTGEEAYSIAIEAEELRRSGVDLSWQVLASDISTRTVERARAGSFRREIVERAIDARPDLSVRRYFEAVGEEQMRPVASLRSRVETRVHNVFESVGRAFDIVMLRNVIIYFSAEDRCRVIESVTRALRPGGLLILGESEALGRESPDLEYESACVYRKRS